MISLIPESTQNLAKEIVKSWQSNHSNYIVVAAPLIPIKPLIDLIRDNLFVDSVIGAGKLEDHVIAVVDNLNYANDERFVKKILSDWRLDYKYPDLTNPLSVLEDATESLKRCGKSPIIIILRFHDLLKKLSEDIGTTLRNLEHNLQLKTIVELPVTLREIRHRNTENSPFLVSDFGQGHLNKVLRGYTLHEVEQLVTEKNGSKEDAIIVFTQTGGMPNLVSKSLDYIGQIKGKALENRLQGLAYDNCSRMIYWLDPVGSNVYKKLIKEKFLNSISDPKFDLKFHDWREILIDQSGQLMSKMLGRASLVELEQSDNENPYHFIERHLNKKYFDAIVHFCSNTKCNEIEGISIEIWKLYAELHQAIHREDWPGIQRITHTLECLTKDSKNPLISSLKKDIRPWNDLSKFLCEYLEKESKKTGNEKFTLEQFLFEQYSLNSDAILFYLQLKRLRFSQASVLEPHHALKAVVETPETILQTYMFIVHKVEFHNFRGLTEIEMQEFLVHLKGQPYTLPKQGDKLSFDALIKLCQVFNNRIAEDKRLLATNIEATNVAKSYKERCYQVHSTGLITESIWYEYKMLCEKLLEKLSSITEKNSMNACLPNLINCFFKHQR